MADTIFLRVGTSNTITLPAFIKTLQNFLAVLSDLDATISQNQQGNMFWEVVSLEKNSPPVVGVAPRLKRGRQDVSAYVEAQFIENARLLSVQGDRNEFLSDSALKKIENLAFQTRKQGPMAIYVDGKQQPQWEAQISERTLENVRQLTAPKYTAYSSFYGNLDAISVHAGNEFRVWSEATGKPIRCRFQESDLDTVKGFLKQRVMVAGIVQSNAAGNPISIMVEELEAAAEHELPTIEEMSGYIPNFTDGLTLKEYIERISNE